jgi:L-ascorbate metabolism protein UlaG (beta-lactamase superfamily)
MKFDIEGKTFLHYGDLGHMITDELIRNIGNVDVMFIPVGGYYTIKAETAKEIVDKIDPVIVFPMHYKTKVVDYPIDQLCEYLKYVDDHKHQNSNEIELTKADFTTKRTITLNYE